MARLERRTLTIVTLVSGSILVGIAAHVLTHDQLPIPEPSTVIGGSVVAGSSDGAGSAGGLNVQNIFVEPARKVVPSVVNISTTTKIKRGPPGGQDDLFRKFFEHFFEGPGKRGGPGGDDGDGEEDRGPAPVPQQRAMSLGSGFVIDASGLVMTNNHVVEGADEIKIYFTENEDEIPVDGKVTGRDPELDIALVEVKTKRSLTAAVLGDSDKLEVGEYVIAVGNPIGHGHTVSHGIVSAKERNAPQFPIARYLQTDAPINPGNSGGPMVNLKGEVVGINNAIDARGQGIGFAIPINSVKKVLSQLREKGSVARGYIGVMVNPMTPEIAEQLGVSKDLVAPFVAHVVAGEPAAKAGVEPYDIITEVNGKSVRSPGDLIRAITDVKVGEAVKLDILRKNDKKSIKVTVAQRPAGGEKDPEESSKPKKPSKPEPIRTGMSLETLTPRLARQFGFQENAKGVLVTDLEFDSPAARAGIFRGDVIMEIGQKPVKTTEDFYGTVKEKKSYLLRIRRPSPDGQSVFSVVVLDLK